MKLYFLNCRKVHKLVTIDGVNPKLPNWVQSTSMFVEAILEVENVLAKNPIPSPSTYQQLLNRIKKARTGMVSEEGCKILLDRNIIKEGENSYRFSHDLKLRIAPGMAMMTTEQFSQFWEAIKAPVLFIKAETNDQFSEQASKDFQIAMEMAKTQNPNMNVEYHVAGNHHVHLNSPNLIANIISKFLDS